MKNERSTAGRALKTLVEQARYMKPRGTFIVARSASNSPGDLLRLPVTENLRNEFLISDIHNVCALTKETLIEYGPSRLVPDGHLMWARASAVKMLSELAVEDEANRVIPLYGDEVISSRKLKMTVTANSVEVPGGGVEGVTCYRITADSARLVKAKRVAAIFRGGGFDRLDDEVILFDQSVDAIAFGDYVFFAARRVFEQAFGFVGELKLQASRAFDELIATLRIDGMEEFRKAATTDYSMMAKMASIWRKVEDNPAYMEAVSMENLLKFIDANDHVEVETVGEGPERALIFKTTPKMRWRILKLLDDDFLTSNLTDMDYLVDSKGDPLRRK